MSQKTVLGGQSIELRGMKIYLGKLSRIQSPVLRMMVKRMFSSQPVTGTYENWKKHKEHSDYTDSCGSGDYFDGSPDWF